MLCFDLNEQLKLDEEDSIFLISSLTSPNTTKGLPTKPYVDSLSENNRNRLDMSTVFNDQDNDIDTSNSANLDGITVNRNQLLDEEVSNEKYIGDEIDRNTILRFNRTLKNDLNYVLETMSILFKNITSKKLWIKQKTNVLTKVVTYFSNGKKYILIKIVMEKYKSS